MRMEAVSSKFLPSVEFSRGLAALSVAWFHLTNTYPESWVRSSGHYGFLGVEAFFVISGFIIPYSLLVSDYKVARFWLFMARRMTRLEPPYLLSIAVVVLLAYLSSLAPDFHGAKPSFSAVQIAAHFLYMIPFTENKWVNVVYWTLAYEFVFYIFAGLTYPLLVIRVGFLKQIAFVVFFCFAAFILGALFPLLFLLGIISFRYFVQIDEVSSYMASTAILGFTIGYVAGIPCLFVVIATSGFLVFVRVPQARMISFLGSISYSLYLLHVPIGGRVINLGRRVCDSTTCEFGLSCLALLICILTATIYWHLIERPAQKLSKLIAIN